MDVIDLICNISEIKVFSYNEIGAVESRIKRWKLIGLIMERMHYEMIIEDTKIMVNGMMKKHYLYDKPVKNLNNILMNGSIEISNKFLLPEHGTHKVVAQELYE